MCLEIGIQTTDLMINDRFCKSVSGAFKLAVYSVSGLGEKLASLPPWFKSRKICILILFRRRFTIDSDSQVGECLGTLIKTYKNLFLPYFEELIVYITPMLVSNPQLPH